MTPSGTGDPDMTKSLLPKKQALLYGLLPEVARRVAVACAAIPVRISGSVPSYRAVYKEKHLLPKKQVPW